MCKTLYKCCKNIQTAAHDTFKNGAITTSLWCQENLDPEAGGLATYDRGGKKRNTITIKLTLTYPGRGVLVVLTSELLATMEESPGS